jgi:hypothetical protein
MSGNPLEVAAISPETDARTLLGGERKMRALNNFSKLEHDFIGIHTANLINEPPVAY